MSRCRCGSHRLYKRCCQPWHQGRPAPTAEALMRSRYSAYALGLAAYILDTTDPQSALVEPDRAAWLESVRRFSTTTTFERLEVHDQREDGDQGEVHFTAHLRQGGHEAPMTERSRFVRSDGRWYYTGRA